jgi:predicted metal-binding membrane protein
VRATYVIVFTIFLAAAAVTLFFDHVMSTTMPMPGNWRMSMMWMPMGGVANSASLFVIMWTVMMVAMMLPSTLPMLLLYRRAAAFRGEVAIGRAMFALSGGYFLIWTLFGVIAYLLGLLITRAAMRSDTFSQFIPQAAGFALCIAGVYQLTPWKSSCLRHCRDPLSLVAHSLNDRESGAFRLGVHHGAFCTGCCWGLMLIQLALGVMNLAAMIAVAVVITMEKLLPRGELIAKAVGVASITGGAWLLVTSLTSL